MLPALPDRCALGAIGFPSGLFEWCARALESLGRLEAIPGDPEQVLGVRRFDAVLILLSAPFDNSIATLASIRRRHVLLPLIVLAEGVDANFSAELLKCGAEDFLLIPPSPDALARKVQRALGNGVGPAFEGPEFAAFKPRGVDENLRHCFRVTIPPDFGVASTFPGPVDRPLEVKDLSIETDKGPGGMQIAADRPTARRLPFEQWNRRRQFEISVQLPSGDPISTRARLVPGLRGAPDGTIRFAVEYWATHPGEKERFRRYWVEVQRRARRSTVSQRRVAADPKR
jgi:hypothetical protein